MIIAVGRQHDCYPVLRGTDRQGGSEADETILAGSKEFMLSVGSHFYSGIDEGCGIGKLSLVFVVRFFIEDSGNQRIALVIGLFGALLEVHAADFEAADTDNFAVITVNGHQEKTGLLPAFFKVGNVCQDILLGNVIFLGMQKLISLRIGVDVEFQLPGAVKADVIIAGNLWVAAEHTNFVEQVFSE